MSAVRTWADSFGVWHARVTFGELRAYNEALSANVRRQARRAIRRELSARAPAGTSIVTRIRLVSMQSDSEVPGKGSPPRGWVRAVTYAERRGVGRRSRPAGKA